MKTKRWANTEKEREEKQQREIATYASRCSKRPTPAKKDTNSGNVPVVPDGNDRHQPAPAKRERTRKSVQTEPHTRCKELAYATPCQDPERSSVRRKWPQYIRPFSGNHNVAFKQVAPRAFGEVPPSCPCACSVCWRSLAISRAPKRAGIQTLWHRNEATMAWRHAALSFACFRCVSLLLLEYGTATSAICAIIHVAVMQVSFDGSLLECLAISRSAQQPVSSASGFLGVRVPERSESNCTDDAYVCTAHTNLIRQCHQGRHLNQDAQVKGRKWGTSADVGFGSNSLVFVDFACPPTSAAPPQKRQESSGMRSSATASRECGATAVRAHRLYVRVSPRLRCTLRS